MGVCIGALFFIFPFLLQCRGKKFPGTGNWINAVHSFTQMYDGYNLVSSPAYLSLILSCLQLDKPPGSPLSLNFSTWERPGAEVSVRPFQPTLARTRLGSIYVALHDVPQVGLLPCVHHLSCVSVLGGWNACTPRRPRVGGVGEQAAVLTDNQVPCSYLLSCYMICCLTKRTPK